MSSLACIFPSELLDEIFAYATSSSDFAILRSLSLVSRAAAFWAGRKLCRHVCVPFNKLPRFMELERPKLESLEIYDPPDRKEYREGNLEWLADKILRNPYIWPSLCRLCVRDLYYLSHAARPSTLDAGIASLPNLTVLYVEYSSQIFFTIDPLLVFPSLTHLYCYSHPALDEGDDITVFPSCFPVLTHVALTTMYLDVIDEFGVYLDTERVGRASMSWLALPCLRRLIFRWDHRELDENDEQFASQWQQCLNSFDLDDRVVFVAALEEHYTPSSEIDSCFDFMDIVWKLGEEASEKRQKEIRAVGEG